MSRHVCFLVQYTNGPTVCDGLTRPRMQSEDGSELASLVIAGGCLLAGQTVTRSRRLLGHFAANRGGPR